MSAAAATPSGQCESVRGEWGGICPDCGQRLPELPGPLGSWMASRPMRDGVRWDGTELQPRNENLAAARRARQERALHFRPDAGQGRAPRLMMEDVVAALRTSRGSMNAAAPILRCARQSIVTFLARNRVAVPADVAAMLAARRKPKRADLGRKVAAA